MGQNKFHPKFMVDARCGWKLDHDIYLRKLSRNWQNSKKKYLPLKKFMLYGMPLCSLYPLFLLCLLLGELESQFQLHLFLVGVCGSSLLNVLLKTSGG